MPINIYSTTHSILKDVLCLMLGALTVFSFAPYNIWPVCLLTLAIFLRVVFQSSRSHAFIRGFFFGVGFFGFGLSWLFYAVHELGSIPFGWSLVLLSLLVAYCALFYGVFAIIASYVYSKGILLWSIGIPLCWVALEITRGYLTGGFGWFYIGYAFVDTPLAGYGPLLGVSGISFVVIVTSLSFVVFLQRTKLYAHIFIIVFIVLWIGGVLLTPLQWTKQTDMSITATIVQGNFPQERVEFEDLREEKLSVYTNKSLDHLSSDIIVWPESTIEPSIQFSGHALRELALLARASGTTILAGTSDAPSPHRRYVALVVFGEVVDIYRKHLLVPFGEYIPDKLREVPLIDNTIIPDQNFSPGHQKQVPLSISGVSIAPSICFESITGEYIRRSAKNANILVNITNDDWYGDNRQPSQHLQIARMRALENQKPMIRAANTGISAFIHADGTILSGVPYDKRQTLTEIIAARTGQTPYGRWGYGILGTFIGLYALWIIVISFFVKKFYVRHI